MAGPVVLPSLNAVIIANVFVMVVLADDAAERSAVAFSSTSIAVSMARLTLRRMYSPTNIEVLDFADISPLDLRACSNANEG